jgi:CheY-like chemotaxis protein
VSALTLAGARVLVVEDDYVVADALRFLIEGFGGRVTAIVPSVERAREAIAAEPVDVAVLDINLHGVSVAPLADHLRVHDVPFVFLTGYGDADMLPEHLRDRPRLSKPVQPDPLIRALIDLLGQLRVS